jgi:hypothetical protein
MRESPERREATLQANLTGSFGHDLDLHLELAKLPNRRKQPGTEFDAWNAVPNFLGKGTARLIYGSAVSGFKSAVDTLESESPALAPSESAAGQSGGWYAARCSN